MTAALENRERSLSQREAELIEREDQLSRDREDLHSRERRLEGLADSVVGLRDARKEIETLRQQCSNLEEEKKRLESEVNALAIQLDSKSRLIELRRREIEELRQTISAQRQRELAAPPAGKWVDIDEILTYSCWTDDMKESATRILQALQRSGKFHSVNKAVYDPSSGNMHFVARLKANGNSLPPTIVIGANWNTRRTWSAVHQHGQSF
jgi:DNA repair exonuclease SbcCD ATPase subunit